MNKPFTEKVAADQLGCSVSSMRKGRLGKGPLAALPFLKIGRAVRYEPDAIAAFKQRSTVAPCDSKAA